MIDNTNNIVRPLLDYYTITSTGFPFDNNTTTSPTSLSQTPINAISDFPNLEVYNEHEQMIPKR